MTLNYTGIASSKDVFLLVFSGESFLSLFVVSILILKVE